ncbi:MAG: DUF6106 family protein [Clostridiales bacterium]|nr:DUF6106 family protein [Clostridiales bacterium]
MEKFVIIPAKKKFVIAFLGILFFVLAVICLAISCLSLVFLLVAVVLAALGYWFTFRWNKEFEYSYFDGEVRFARIMNKARRKRLAVFDMDEVEVIAPAGDRRVENYEKDSSVVVRDYTSGMRDVPYYEMVVHSGDGTIMIKYEPDDEYLDAIMPKFAYKVVRKPKAIQQPES